MGKRARHGSYIFQRPGSSNWYIKLRSGGKRTEKSLGTSDKTRAEEMAATLIGEHKARLIAARPHLVWDRAFEPGEHAGPDGGRVIASETDLIFLNHNGAFLRTEPNRVQKITPLYPDVSASAMAKFNIAMLKDEPARPTVPVKDDDDKLLETYLTHNNITGLKERQARDIWHIFKTVVKKPIKQCTRDHGRDIVAHMIEQAGGRDEIASATLRRRMVPLVAVVNLAIKDGLLTFNPFAGCVPDNWEDEEEREAFSDADMVLIRANLHKLDANDQLLVRILATTGMRRGEVFEIDGEEVENGIRYATIGTKTPQSRRPVPFPADLLPHLPKKIRGQLIQGRMDTAGKRLKAWLHDIGITDEDKAPMHSFRHRAAQRMRAAGIPEDVREAIGGWANGKKKVSRKYGNKHGKGYPITVLKDAIDKIGF